MKKIAVVKDFVKNKIKYRGIYINGLANSIYEVENESHKILYLNHLNYLRDLGYEIKFD